MILATKAEMSFLTFFTLIHSGYNKKVKCQSVYSQDIKIQVQS